MPQAKLPDVNSAIVTWRANAISSFKRHDYNTVKVAIRAMIALLPEDYRVNISTDAYTHELESVKMIKCRYCKAEPVKFMDVLIETRYNSPAQQLLLQTQRSKTWQCKACHKTNVLDKTTDWLLSKPEDPYYSKIIPDTPLQTSFFERLGYEQKFASWYTIAMAEIENQIQLYRTEYIRQNPNVVEDIDPSLMTEVEGTD